jgi:LCP family protein required for cell wall assembly
MFIKNKIVVMSVIIVLAASASAVFAGCSGEESSSTDAFAGTVEEAQGTDRPVAESVETTSTTEALQSYYTSSSGDFDNYSFTCPEGWKIYETDSGRRVILENTNSGSDIENIFIFVEDISADETINDSGDIVDLYKNTATDDATAEFFEEEDIKLDGLDSKIFGYSYQSDLDNDEKEKPTYTDYFTFTERNDFLYSIKLITSGSYSKDTLEDFKSFLDIFSLSDQTAKNIEEEESPYVNILILGDDSGMGRAGGRVNGRTDIIILLHLNLDKCKGTAVTIPRDTWIDIPGHGEGKINGAHAIGGNELTVKAVEQLSGLEIDNYIITDFDGFIPLIDFLGGVTVEVGEDLSDDFSGCYLSKGVHHLDGQQALALSRNRHRSGDGSTQAGAFAREKEAAKIIVALLEQKSTFERIVAMPLFINYLLNYTWTDLGFKDVIRLLPVMGKVRANDIEITGIPSWPQSFGKASAVAYDEEATAELFEEIKSQ